MEKVAICAVIKDEHPYLKEWLDYHFTIGVTDIHLYEDDGSLSHYDICKEYSNVFLHDLLGFIGDRFNGSIKQGELYNRFIKTYKDDVDYVFFIDLDEFVSFDEGYTLSDLMELCRKEGAVLLPWKMYGADGLIENPKRKVVETFRKPVRLSRKDIHMPYKSFVYMKNDSRENFMSTHHRHAMAAMSRLNTKTWYRLNHYVTKSWEEWCERIFKRGQIQRNYRRLDEFFEYNPDMASIKEELYSTIKEKI